ncbi:MAG: hypothetical protein EZS28_016921 [Streblomastix strix]|uniref:SKP1 component dimerisation domain-containing protein n=1 Tax=Streblomastix strix TaxID=222440 RepID=A0A5J4VY32_9EUKA|nr:MAG: hypothetical protein EZS28_016921 [Streblomastix strix]
MTNSGNTIRFELTDGKVVDLDKELARGLRLFYTFLEIAGDFGEDSSQAIPCNATSQVFSSIVEFLEHSRSLTKGQCSSDESTDWEKRYFSSVVNNLAEIMNVANLLGADELLEFLCNQVSAQLNKKKASDIRELFGIEYDFNEAEQAEIEEESLLLESM